MLKNPLLLIALLLTGGIALWGILDTAGLAEVANIVLADEINRAPAKVQAALHKAR